MMQTRTNLSGKFSTISQCWAGPIFAAFLCGVVIIFFFTTHSFVRGFPIFFAFLPMAFFYGATMQAKSERQIRELQKRIEQLESPSQQPLP